MRFSSFYLIRPLITWVILHSSWRWWNRKLGFLYSIHRVLFIKLNKLGNIAYTFVPTRHDHIQLNFYRKNPFFHFDRQIAHNFINFDKGDDFFFRWKFSFSFWCATIAFFLLLCIPSSRFRGTFYCRKSYVKIFYSIYVKVENSFSFKLNMDNSIARWKFFPFENDSAVCSTNY